MMEKNERDQKAKEEMDKDMGDMKDNMRQMKGKEKEGYGCYTIHNFLAKFIFYEIISYKEIYLFLKKKNLSNCLIFLIFTSSIFFGRKMIY